MLRSGRSVLVEIEVTAFRGARRSGGRCGPAPFVAIIASAGDSNRHRATALPQGARPRGSSPFRSCRPTSGGPSRSRSSCWLYLKGISTGDFTEAGRSSYHRPRRSRDVWQGELARWEQRDLSARRYLYFWADGIYFQPRMEHDKQCILVIIGADQWGRKELLAIADGYRESAQSWRELLLDLKRRGLRWRPSWPSETGRSASGRPCTRATARRANSAAGCTRPATF